MMNVLEGIGVVSLVFLAIVIFVFVFMFIVNTLDSRRITAIHEKDIMQLKSDLFELRLKRICDGRPNPIRPSNYPPPTPDQEQA